MHILNYYNCSNNIMHQQDTATNVIKRTSTKQDEWASEPSPITATKVSDRPAKVLPRISHTLG